MKEIIVAVITGLCAVVGQWLISRRQNKDREISEAVRAQQMADRLQAVENKLDIHNGYAEKLGEIEKSIAVIETNIKNIYKGGISHG